MKPVHFDEANVLVCPPEGMEGHKIPMWKGQLDTGQPVVISSWELSDEELAELLRNKRLWVIEHSEHHPIAFMTTKPIEQRVIETLSVAPVPGLAKDAGTITIK